AWLILDVRRKFMPHYHRPHSSEWFEALLEANPQQAQHTAQIVKLAGREDVCSVCGDIESQEYQILKMQFAPGVVASIRLCQDCKSIREGGFGEDFIPLHEEDDKKN